MAARHNEPAIPFAKRVSRGADGTLRIGQGIGQAALPGDLVALDGDLGAGKTTLAQGIGRGLGLSERDVVSPTFTLVAEHTHGRIPFYHLDVYRLRSAADLVDLGFDDILNASDGLIAIEWAGRVAAGLPADRLEIRLEAGSDPAERLIVLRALGPRSRSLLERFSSILP